MQKIFYFLFLLYFSSLFPCFSQTNKVSFKIDYFVPGEVQLLPGDALDVLNKLGEWMLSWSEKVNSDLFQNMLDAEQGGMNEVVADLYSLTGNSNYLKLARKFCHFSVLYPVANGKDGLFSCHANDQIPGFFEAARINGWFSYQLSINPDQKKNYLFCKFWGDETPEHQFDILVDNVPVTTVKLNRHLPVTYVEDLIEIPSNITSGKKKFNVTFKAENGHVAGNLYALKINNDKNIR